MTTQQEQLLRIQELSTQINGTESEQAAQMLFERLHTGRKILALDWDGVLDNNLFPLIGLHNNFLISLVTSRDSNLLPYIDIETGKLGNPVKLYRSAHSFERGCVAYKDFNEYPQVSSEYMDFLQLLDSELFGIIDQKEPTWKDVLSGKAAWCKSEPPWNGKYTRSVWYQYGDYHIRNYLDNYISNLATMNGNAVHISVSNHEQPENRLAWSKIAQHGIHKAQGLMTPEDFPDVYITDAGGGGERETIEALRKGFTLDDGTQLPPTLVAVIGESPDELNDDMDWCRKNADILIPTNAEMLSMFQMVNELAAQQT